MPVIRLVCHLKNRITITDGHPNSLLDNFVLRFSEHFYYSDYFWYRNHTTAQHVAGQIFIFIISNVCNTKNTKLKVLANKVILPIQSSTIFSSSIEIHLYLFNYIASFPRGNYFPRIEPGDQCLILRCLF